MQCLPRLTTSRKWGSRVRSSPSAPNKSGTSREISFPLGSSLPRRMMIIRLWTSTSSQRHLSVTTSQIMSMSRDSCQQNKNFRDRAHKNRNSTTTDKWWHPNNLQSNRNRSNRRTQRTRCRTPILKSPRHPIRCSDRTLVWGCHINNYKHQPNNYKRLPNLM
jgi:hypothetical protein